MKLAKAGWMNGDPKAILKADADMVIHMVYYEGYENDLLRSYERLRE